MKNTAKKTSLRGTAAALLILIILSSLTSVSCGLLRPAVPTQTSAGETKTEPATSPTLPVTSEPTIPVIVDPTTADDTTSPKTTEPLTETRISFLGAGDNIIYYGNVLEAASLAVPGGRQYNFKPMYSHVADLIKNADIAFINQETQMTGDAPSYYPNFNSPQDLGYDLAELGFDVIGIANNHMLDKSDKGLEKTISFLKSLDPVLMIGGYENEEDYLSTRYIERDGIKIAFLSYCEHANGLSKSASSDVYLPYFRIYEWGNESEEAKLQKRAQSEAMKPKIAAQIEKAKATSDLVIVSVHWGDENTYTPNGVEKEYSQFFADSGADVIIGHHPHVIQPVEWLTSASGEKTLCVYSLGNFLSEQANDYQMLGGMINFDIVKLGNKTTVENVVFEPIVTYFTTNWTRNSVWLLSDFTDELAASHGITTYDSSYGYSEAHHMTVAELKTIVKSVIAKEFLPDYLK